MVGAEGTKICDFDNPRSVEKTLPGITSKITSTYKKILKVLKLLLKNVEEILFGRIFLGAHTGQTVSKHVWVRQWIFL